MAKIKRNEITYKVLMLFWKHLTDEKKDEAVIGLPNYPKGRIDKYRYKENRSTIMGLILYRLGSPGWPKKADVFPEKDVSLWEMVRTWLYDFWYTTPQWLVKIQEREQAQAKESEDAEDTPVRRKPEKKEEKKDTEEMRIKEEEATFNKRKKEADKAGSKLQLGLKVIVVVFVIFVCIGCLALGTWFFDGALPGPGL